MATGFLPAQSLEISIGIVSRTLLAVSNSVPFSVPLIRDGPVDVFAVRNGGTNQFSIPDRFVLRRGVDLPSGTALPAIDFNSAEAFAPVTARVTVSGARSGDSYAAYTGFRTPTTRPTSSIWSTVFPTGENAATYFALPASQVLPSDMQEVVAFAFGADGLDHMRATTKYFRTPSDQTLAVGPPLTAPVVTTVTMTPYVRLRVTNATPSEYNTAFGVEFIGRTQYFAVFTTVAYLGARPAVWDVVMPDLSAAPGFNLAWGLTSGATVVNTTAYGGSRGALVFGAPPLVDETFMFALGGTNFTASPVTARPTENPAELTSRLQATRACAYWLDPSCDRRRQRQE